MVNYLKQSIIVLLIILTCGIALATYKQYGMSWDEPAQRGIGIINYKYIADGDQQLLGFYNRDYGPAFELPLAAMERVTKLRFVRDIFFLRHITAHLFFLLGAVCCFLLVDFLYKSKLLATIAFLLILLHPRLYAHSFFNTKDIPFLSMFLICFYLNAIAFSKNKIGYFVLLGAGAGLLVNLRIIGVLFVCCVLFFLAMDAFQEVIKKKSPVPTISLSLVFLVTACVTLYITWPFLWKNPVENFMFAFKNMSNFRWNGSVLFNGVFIKSNELPWYYIPVWFAITTPVPYLIAGLFGIVLLAVQFLKEPGRFLSNTPMRNNLLFAICSITPIAAVIILNSVLYDGWRHMYFTYSGFVLMIIYGLNAAFKTRLKNYVIAAFLLAFCSIGYFMVETIPFQHVYFNNLVDRKTPENLRKQFELDYWGTSYKQSLDYILNNNSSALIRIAFLNEPGKFNTVMLLAEQSKRIKIVEDMKDATYYITNYRSQAHDAYSAIEAKKYYSIKVGNNTINSVFKLR